MNYKAIFRSRELRIRILRMLSFIPDKSMLRFQYRMKQGKKLDLKQPMLYTEKIQWYKLNWHDPVMVPCVDKYDVRAYIESKGYGALLTKCYGVYERVEDIDFDALPRKFVMKDTLAGGGLGVIIVHDKSALDMNQVKKTLQKWLNTRMRFAGITIKGTGREWPYYSGKKHRILIEELLEDQDVGGLSDYKFLCFQGRAAYVQFMTDRVLGQGKMAEGILSRDFNLLPIYGEGHERLLPEDIRKPERYEEMLAIADALSSDFPHARIDLYNIHGRIVFGEITFFPASGYKKFQPASFDLELGKQFVLPRRMK